MNRPLVGALKTIRRVSFEDSDLGQLLRFSFVYILLFLLMLCGSSGALGQVETSTLSLDRFETKSVNADAPAFGNYFFDVRHFKGDSKKIYSEIEALTKARQDHVEKLLLQERAELSRLKEEHKSLMWNAGNHGFDVQDKKTEEFSKWNVAMFSNISQQMLLKENTQSTLSSWDTKNYLKVRSFEKNGKKMVLSLQVFREKKKGTQKAVASIP